RRTFYEQLALGYHYELLMLHIRLVHNLAHELFENVLQGDEPVSSSIFVDHHTHMNPTGLEVTQQAGQGDRSGDEERLARKLSKCCVAPPVDQRAISVASIQNADDIVDRLAVNGNAREAHF